MRKCKRIPRGTRLLTTLKLLCGEHFHRTWLWSASGINATLFEVMSGHLASLPTRSSSWRQCYFLMLQSVTLWQGWWEERDLSCWPASAMKCEQLQQMAKSLHFHFANIQHNYVPYSGKFWGCKFSNNQGGEQNKISKFKSKYKLSAKPHPVILHNEDRGLLELRWPLSLEVEKYYRDITAWPKWYR